MTPTTSTRRLSAFAVPSVFDAVERANSKLAAFTDSRIHVEAGDIEADGKVLVSLHYPPLKARGFTLVARFERAAIINEDNSPVRFALDALYDRSVSVDSFPTPTGSCAVCGETRDRKRVYLVLSEEGSPLFVGGSCADDLNLTRAPAESETRGLIEETMDESERIPAEAIRTVGVDLTTGLSILVQYEEAVRREPYLKLFAFLYGGARLTLTPEDLRNAAELRAVLQGDDVYDVASKAGRVTERALLDLYFSLDRKRREAADRARAAARAERAAVASKAGVVGEPGKRIEVAARVALIREFRSTNYGFDEVRRLIVFEVAEGPQMGAVLKWWTSSSPTFAQGETVQLRATVKAHGEYQGVPETTLLRCKVA